MGKKESHKKYVEKNREKVASWNRNWIINNRERYNASKWILADKIKRQVINHYSNGSISCKHCHETDINILTIDHINDNGAEERRSWSSDYEKRGGVSQYRKIIKEGFKDGYQVLCFNCNWKKEMERRMSRRLENKFFIEYLKSLK